MNNNKINVSVNDFITIKDYVKYLCKQKQINMKQLSLAVDVNYKTFLSNLDRSIHLRTIVKVIDYLDGDLNIAMHLPLKKEGKLIYDND